ncbi:methylated-DNA--[protein]-cysteine S-methyltransferase [Oscillatoria sp. CS-180]|uniref:methylated-DNA--[protein]-cysteine S-methyltransferase n=1 Tax=Oscillatoria sp. CS-180 TaxID=3021720 RepID=UPI00232CAA1D|nr:methylated-DNA--[protein]-cysteine S-methyltransferase [Oscillatoria sp. CS-180]MDB9528510.1 methylated-DNA--[protein]-cysteine S-methyltransferase [Oscillatoria sp. CS-180]
MIYYHHLESPLGQLLLTSDGRSLTGLYLEGQKYYPQMTQTWLADRHLDVLSHAQTQLEEYFAHQRQTFDLPLAPTGTDFQQRVWQALSDITFGTTISYGTLAQVIGMPSASRAVGAANGRNPISIVVPCHRVIAANQSLTGYAGGLDRKRWLLKHEQGRSNFNVEGPNVKEAERFQQTVLPL